MAIDGACRGSGTSDARSTIGVYFAAYSRWNISVPSDDSTPTNQRAELVACLAALQEAYTIKRVPGWSEEEFHFYQLIIKADSEYVVKGMTERVFKWRKNGYKMLGVRR